VRPWELNVIGLQRMRQPCQAWRNAAAGLTRPNQQQAVPAELNSAALYAHFRSRQSTSFADKLMPAMPNPFGAHLEPNAARSPRNRLRHPAACLSFSARLVT